MNITEKLEKYLGERYRGYLKTQDKKLQKVFDTELWIVVKRRGEDLDKDEDLIQATIEELVLQVAGGLDLGEIQGIFSDEKEAEEYFDHLAELHGNR